MMQELFQFLPSFFGGLLGGAGLLAIVIRWWFKRKEIEFQARLERLSSRKFDVYRKCIAFLREAFTTYRIIEGFEIWNDLVNDLILCASPSVYIKARDLLWKISQDPTGKELGLDEIQSLITAMVKDLNPLTALKEQDILLKPKLEMSDPLVIELEKISFKYPKEFHEIAVTLKQNALLRHEIERYHFGDLYKVVETIKREIGGSEKWLND